MRRLAIVLIVCSLAVPRAHASDRDLGRTAVQGIAGTGAGLLAGGVTFMFGLSYALCECDDADADLGTVFLLATPPVFALAHAGAVHLVGRGFDGRRRGSFKATLLGAGAGTAAGLLVWHADGYSTGGFVAAMGLATAGSLTGYNLTRRTWSPRSGLEVAAPSLTPTVQTGLDGKVHRGARMSVLDLRF